ncbi:MAG: hypothetical protein Q9162_000549 [Coniocarpon cinnabarinum]
MSRHAKSKPLSARVRKVESNAALAEKFLLQDVLQSQLYSDGKVSNMEEHRRFQAVSVHLAQLPLELRSKALFQALSADLATTGFPGLVLIDHLLRARKDWATCTNISPILLMLAHHMSARPSYWWFEVCARDIVHILQMKNLHPTQHAVEAIVLAVVKTLSPAGPAINPRHCRRVFARLCQVLQALLARNTLRRRLRGRMHLVLAPLQALLRCLFVPTDPSASSRIQHPPWYTPTPQPAQPVSVSVPEQPAPAPAPPPLPSKSLNAKNAIAFARLLTLVADPPLSALSASSSRSKSNPQAAASESSEPLTDPAAQARTYASHFAPYLLEEYANCLLRGRFCDDGVREAVQPGIWALLEIVQRNGIGIDALGAMAGKAQDAREVLRFVVGEWRRNMGARAGR